MRHALIGVILLSAFVTAPAFACGPTTNGKDISPKSPKPPLAAALDHELAAAKLADSDRKTLEALRAAIAGLAAANKLDAARDVEVQAMSILGYKKLWLHCGPGTFLWMKLAPKAPSSHQPGPGPA
jgi:hypothetical protein